MLQVAADPATRSPARLAEAGPWWDPAEVPAQPNQGASADLHALEAELDAVGGFRIQLQHAAREQLRSDRQPVTRGTVITRAVELLHDLRPDWCWPESSRSGGAIDSW